LCAVGMCQLFEDHLDRDSTGLRRLGRALRRSGVSGACWMARVVATGGGVIDEVGRSLKDRATIACVTQLHGLIRDLADQLVKPGSLDSRFDAGVRDFLEAARSLERVVASMPEPV